MSTIGIPVFTKAKAIAAGIGASCTAVIVFLGVLLPDLADNKIDATEIGALVVAVVSLFGTVYAVWRTPNRIVTSQNNDQH
jgi:hypothetical protein